MLGWGVPSKTKSNYVGVLQCEEGGQDQIDGEGHTAKRESVLLLRHYTCVKYCVISRELEAV